MGPINPYFNTVAYQTPTTAMPAGVSANATPAMIVPATAPATPAAAKISPMLLLVLLAGALFIGHKKTQPEDTELADDDLLQTDGDQNWGGPDGPPPSDDTALDASTVTQPKFEIRQPNQTQLIAKAFEKLLAEKPSNVEDGSSNGVEAKKDQNTALPKIPENKPEETSDPPKAEEKPPEAPVENKELPMWARMAATAVGTVAAWGARIGGAALSATGIGAVGGVPLIVGSGVIGAGTEEGAKWLLAKYVCKTDYNFSGKEFAASAGANALGGLGHVARIGRAATAAGSTAAKTGWIARGEQALATAVNGTKSTKKAVDIVTKGMNSYDNVLGSTKVGQAVKWMNKPIPSTLRNGGAAYLMYKGVTEQDDRYLLAAQGVGIFDTVMDGLTVGGVQGMLHSVGSEAKNLDGTDKDLLQKVMDGTQDRMLFEPSVAGKVIGVGAAYALEEYAMPALQKVALEKQKEQEKEAQQKETQLQE